MAVQQNVRTLEDRLMQEEQDDPGRVVLEVRKLRWELSFWARAAAVAVPIAAFVVAASQVAIAWWDTSSKDQLAQQDLHLKEIESGVNLVQFTNAQTQKLLSANLEERSQALAYAATLLPAEQACQVINAVIIASPGHADFIAPARQMRELIAQRDLDARARAECTNMTIFDTQNTIAIAVAQAAQTAAAPLVTAAVTPAVQAAPSVQPAAPVPTAAASCPAPSGPSVLPLVVYYQIVRKQDRDIASRVGYDMPSGFPSAGIEYVPETDPAKQYPQVRYYYPEQKDAAEYLACLLTEAYTRDAGKKPTVNGQEVSFSAVSIAKKYSNLPPGRVEVWFPAMASEG
jgi:hypothetical protein